MGIKELNGFLIRNIKDKGKKGIRSIHLSKYRNKCLAIDVSIFLYRILYRQKDKHIEGFLNLISKLKNFDIDLIFIFDGRPPKEKKNVLDNRRKNRNKIKHKIAIIQDKLDRLDKMEELDITDSSKNINNNIDLTESFSSTESDTLISSFELQIPESREELQSVMKKLNKKCVSIKKKHITDLKELFDLCDIKYIHSNQEADKICAHLVIIGKAHACVSNDMDLLPFGCTKLLRDFNFNNNFVTEYNLPTICNSLHMNYNKFVDFCIMCGCDYNEKIIGLKPQRNYYYLNKYGTIENVIKHMESINCNETHRVRISKRFDYVRSRHLFLEPLSSSDYTIHNDNINNKWRRSLRSSSDSDSDWIIIDGICSPKYEQNKFFPIENNVIENNVITSEYEQVNELNNEYPSYYSVANYVRCQCPTMHEKKIKSKLRWLRV